MTASRVNWVAIAPDSRQKKSDIIPEQDEEDRYLLRSQRVGQGQAMHLSGAPVGQSANSE